MFCNELIESVAHKLQSIAHLKNFPLAKATTFGIGGNADLLVRPNNSNELHHALLCAREHNLPVFILGGGSNLLVSDAGLRGMVIKLAGDFAKITVSDDRKEMYVGAGATFPMLTHAALKAGWRSALGWHGTPGLVGGALIMNAGGRLGEIGDTVVDVYTCENGEKKVIPKTNAAFLYRRSALPGNGIVTGALLRCEEGCASKSQLLVDESKILTVRRKATQPKAPSAGSVFKNPPGDFAGRLIEHCGLKGMMLNGAQISSLHANFIINAAHATAADVYKLAQCARNTVFEKTGVMLEYEIRFAGIFEEK